jgi:hypothetical protein
MLPPWKSACVGVSEANPNLRAAFPSPAERVRGKQMASPAQSFMVQIMNRFFTEKCDEIRVGCNPERRF